MHFDLESKIQNLHPEKENYIEEHVGIVATSSMSAREGMHYTCAKTCMPIEEHARSILTPYAYNVFQNEAVLSLQYATTELTKGSYLVQHYKKIDEERLVLWELADEQIQCSCKEFEHSGILCRHSIRVLTMKNYFQLPMKYFLPQRRPESLLAPFDEQNPQSSSDECAQAFHSLAASLLTESLISKERFNYVHRELTGVLKRVKNMEAVDEFAVNVAANNVNES